MIAVSMQVTAFILNILFHHVARRKHVPTIGAVWLHRARILTAVRALYQFRFYLTVYHSISGIDLEDLGLDMFVGETEVIS